MFGLWKKAVTQHKLFRFKWMRHPRHPQHHIRTIVEALLYPRALGPLWVARRTKFFKLVTFDFLRRHSSRSGCFQVTEFPEPENKHHAQLLIPFVFSFKYKNTQAMQREQRSIVSDFTKPSSGATIASCHLYISSQTHLTFTLKRPRAELTHAPFGPPPIVCTLDHFDISLGEALNV